MADPLVKKLLEASKNKDEANQDKVSKVLEKTDHEEVLQSVIKCVRSGSQNAYPVVKVVLAGCLDLDSLKGLRQRVLRSVLKITFEPDAKVKIDESVITEILWHLDQEPHLCPSEIAQLVAICVEEFKSNQDSLNPRWLPLLARLLSMANDQDFMVDLAKDGDQVKPSEFRLSQLRSLCVGKWNSAANLAAAVAMFREMAPLSNDEMSLIMEKVTNELKKLDPEEVPPVVYQSLLLTQHHGASISRLYSCLMSYFDTTSIQDNDEEGSEDVIESSNQVLAKLKKAESIVLVHINNSARMVQNVGKEIVKMVKTSQNVPEILWNPFALQLALSLTSLSEYRSNIIEEMKKVISKTIASSVRARQNIWFAMELKRQEQHNHSSSSIFDRHFKKFVGDTTNHGSWELIGDGLLDLGLALLDANPGLGKADAKIRSMWQLGQDLLREISRQRMSAVPLIIKKLTNRIMFSKAAPKFTDALKDVVDEGKAELLQKPSDLNEVLDHIVNLNYSGGKRVLQALMPIIKTSTSFRSQTIMVIRKALFSNKPETRRVAVNGVLTLLKSFKISPMMRGSGGSSFCTQMLLSQSSAGLSQIAADVHSGRSVSHEAVCLELIGYLKRVLSQQVGVKMSLYQGLYDVIVKNPDLTPKILQLLNQHADNLNLNNPNSMVAMDLGEAVFEDDGEVKLVEPIGWFINCLQLLTTKAQQNYGIEERQDDQDLGALDKLEDLLDSLTNKISTANLADLNLEKTDYNRATVQGQVNALKADCMKNAIESLMEYTITHGADKKQNKAELLIQLFHRHKMVSDLLKDAGNAPKAGPGGGGGQRNKKQKKKIDDTTSQLEDNVGGKAKDKAKKEKLPQITIPEHAFSLRALSVALKMVLLDREPSHQIAVAYIRDSDSFTSYLFKVVKDKLSELDKILVQSSYGGLEGADTVLIHLKSIGLTLITYVIQENPEATDSFLSPLLDVLSNLVQLIGNHFSRKKADFYGFMVDVSTKESTDSIITNLIMEAKERLTKIQDSLDDENGDSIGDILAGYFRLMTILVNEIENDGATNLKDIYQWSKSYCEKSTTEDPRIFKPAFELLLLTTSRVKEHANLHKDIAMKTRIVVGTIDHDKTDNEEPDSSFGFITKDTGESVLLQMFPHLDLAIESAEVMISRCKQICSDSAIIPTKFKDDLPDLESRICNALARVSNPLKLLVRTKLKNFDVAIKMLTKFYHILWLLAKHFLVRSKTSAGSVKAARFDTAITTIGIDLTPKIYEFFGFLNLNNTQIASAGKDIIKAKSKVSKDTKNIPKLVEKIEALEQELIKLQKQSKINNLIQKVSQSRDFRIQLKNLLPEGQQGNQENSRPENDDNEEEEAEEPVAESTRIGTPTYNSTMLNSRTVLSSQNSQSQSLMDSQDSQDSQPPPPKKLKVMMSFNKAKKASKQ